MQGPDLGHLWAAVFTRDRQALGGRQAGTGEAVTWPDLVSGRFLYGDCPSGHTEPIWVYSF